METLFKKQMMRSVQSKVFHFNFTINMHTGSAGKISEEQWICQMLWLSPVCIYKGR